MNRNHAWLLSLSMTLPASFAVADPGSEVRALAPFHAVEVSGGIDVQAAPGDQKVELRGDPADLADLVTEVKGNSLVLSWKSTLSLRSHHGVTALVTVPRLEALRAHGGAHATTERLPIAAIELSGGASLDAQGLSGPLSLEASGGSRATLRGSGVEPLAIKASGGAQVHAAELSAHTATLHGSGGSRIESQVDGTLAAELSGGSACVVKGHPTASQQVSGGASLNFQ